MKKDIKVTEQKFDNYNDLATSATNWEHSCTYQLSSTALFGSHKAIELEDIQVSYSSREGGMIHGIRPPKNAISVVLIVECEKEACFSKIKLHTGDVIIFDDNQTHFFMSKGKIKTVIWSISKELSIELISQLSHIKSFLIKDKEKLLSKLLDENEPKKAIMRKNILTTLEKLLDTQEVFTPKLTKGEEIVFKILDDMYEHMDGKTSIELFASKYKVSEKTLQNSFKSLFGYTPKIFLRQLKLNLVHQELKISNQTEINVSRIAAKWGFIHMGSFSKYYKELFGELPSQTLQFKYKEQFELDESCISRQDEL